MFLFDINYKANVRFYKSVFSFENMSKRSENVKEILRNDHSMYAIRIKGMSLNHNGNNSSRMISVTVV